MSKRVTDKNILSEPPRSEARRQLSIFAPLPLLEQEDPAAYNELLTRVFNAVKPADIIEEMWVRDVVDNTWEIFRMRRLKSKLLAAAAEDLRKTIVAPLIVDELEKIEEIEGPEARKFMERANLISNPSARERFAKIVDSACLTINLDTVIARALVKELDSIERIDRLITIAECRRNAALRELDRHRAVFAESLKAAVKGADEEGLNAIATKSNGRKKRANDIAA